ncbi:MAG: guanylate kinase [Planctomycetota bacterium]
MSDQAKGKLIIISGPSGAGKSTIVKKLITSCPLPLKLSISATTRPQRGDDRPGENYIFLSDEEFQSKVQNDEFLEYVEVFGRGHWYGTLKAQVSTSLDQGDWLILEIDVEGAQKVKTSFPDSVSIFIHPGNLDELEKRLRGRATDDDDAIARRLEVASQEMEVSVVYDHVVVNRTIEQTVQDICDLLTQLSDQSVIN